MEIALLAAVLVLGDLYARNNFKFVGERSVKRGDTRTVRFFQKYEIFLRVLGLLLLFSTCLIAERADGIANFWFLFLLFAVAITSLTAATAWPLLRWQR